MTRQETIVGKEVFLGREVFVTVFEDDALAYERYKGLEARVLRLRDTEVTVLFGVDATNLVAIPPQKFDTIRFNYPHHVTAPSHDIQPQKDLLIGFFRESIPLLEKNGEVQVLIKTNFLFGKAKKVDEGLDDENKLYFEGWAVTKCAKEAGLKVDKWDEFYFKDLILYEPTKGFGKNPESLWMTGESLTYHFEIDTSMDNGEQERKN